MMVEPTLSPTLQGNQWELFLDFVKYDRMTGGPDTHLDMIAHMSKGLSFHEATWLAGCYTSVYNVAGGFFIWEAFPWKTMRSHQRELKPWIAKNWEGLPFRRERRAVRSVPKLAYHLSSFADWLAHWDGFAQSGLTPEERYIILWDDLEKKVWGLGRYSLMKLMETLTRQGWLSIACPDIRPIGGDSPRAQLSTLFQDPTLAKGNTDEILQGITTAVAHLRRKSEAHGSPLDMFQAEVYLCEFGQALKHNQYPGRALDSELAHYYKAAGWFGWWDGFWRIRAEMFPSWALGEQHGWDGRRTELGACIPVYNYVWSDFIYDYSNTTYIAAPQRLEASAQNGTKPICECRYSEDLYGGKVTRT